ncbi:MAG: pyridoxamine 5'-phosphate oxidase family protein [Bacteroidales bacterium]|nr:pyridoxamine 5'-phosphate oxidase family protein [Bacteroidales bacterium]
MKSRNIDFISEMESIIDKCEVCHLAMVSENGEPYVLPMNFAYLDQTIFLHSAPVGKKMGILEKNNQVCINFSTDYDLKFVNEEVACSYSMRYKSVLAYGRVEFIEDLKEKEQILNQVMKKYVHKEDFKYSGPAIRNVKVWKVVTSKMEGRAYGY